MFDFAAANSDMFDDVNLQSPQVENNSEKPATPPPISSLSPSQTLHTIDHITRDTSTPKMITKGMFFYLYRVVNTWFENYKKNNVKCSLVM